MEDLIDPELGVVRIWESQLRAMGRKPRLHPNGFVQLDLNDDASQRLHVWPDEPLPAQKTRHTIHDHSFDMKSTVLLGSLTNVMYDFELRDLRAVGPGLYRLFNVRKSGGEETVLEPTLYGASLREVSRRTYAPYETYEMPRGTLHDSAPQGLTATLMVKLRSSRHYAPTVCVPYGIRPDNEFRRESVPEEILWGVIGKAAEAIRL